MKDTPAGRQAGRHRRCRVFILGVSAAKQKQCTGNANIAAAGAWANHRQTVQAQTLLLKGPADRQASRQASTLQDFPVRRGDGASEARM